MSDDVDPRELLSAHLDGELSPFDEARVLALIQADPEVGAELRSLAEVRAGLRSLPEVDVPADFFASLLAGGPARAADPAPSPTVVVSLDARRRHRTRWAAAGAVVAVAAALLLFLPSFGGTDDPAVVPPVAEFAARHGSAVADLASIAGSTGGFEQLADDDLDGLGAVAPAEVAGQWQRAIGFRHESGAMHLMYAHDDEMVSVFEQVGDVDWSQLPAGGQRVTLGDAEAWSMVTEAGEVMVVDRNGTTFTFVSAAPRDDMLQVVQGMPAV